jgi:hypothetical protein
MAKIELRGDSQGTRHRRGWTWLIIMIVSGLPLACATDIKTPITGLPFRYCKVSAPPALERALCEADSTSLWEETKALLQSQNADQRALALAILEKVWKKDRSLGDGLPWDALADDDFEAFVVERLAPAVRDGLSDVPLSDLQQFAIRYRSTPSGREYAIVLIGLTDAPGQTAFLAEMVRKNLEGGRVPAMLALGTMCDRTAIGVLHEVTESRRFSEEEKKVARAAIEERRSSRVRQWCSRALGQDGAVL